MAGLRRASTNRGWAELRLFSGKSVASASGCLACWERAGTAWEAAGAASAGRPDDDDDDLLLGTTAALRGPKLLLLKNYGRTARA